jgi:hypothetical protein
VDFAAPCLKAHFARLTKYCRPGESHFFGARKTVCRIAGIVDVDIERYSNLSTVVALDPTKLRNCDPRAIRTAFSTYPEFR